VGEREKDEWLSATDYVSSFSAKRDNRAEAGFTPTPATRLFSSPKFVGFRRFAVNAWASEGLASWDDVSTFRTHVPAIACSTHRHEVVKLNTIRAADDWLEHRLAPEQEFLGVAFILSLNCLANIKSL
jgi:hypothetical protein